MIHKELFIFWYIKMIMFSLKTYMYFCLIIIVILFVEDAWAQIQVKIYSLNKNNDVKSVQMIFKKNEQKKLLQYSLSKMGEN